MDPLTICIFKRRGESLGLLKIPRRAREAVQALGISSKSVLVQVLKAAGRDEEEMIRLFEEVAERGLSRDDLRSRAPSRRGPTKPRRKPHVFRFRAPDKSYRLALSFRKSTVEKTDLIAALEQILSDLREAE